jgi:heme exporter protein A
MAGLMAIELAGSDLACVRGSREVFAGVGFSVTAGQSLMLTGPNGAGKTTLLRAIAGLVRLAAGRLELRNGDPDALLSEQVHYLGHQDALKPSLSVMENLAFWAAFLATGAAGDSQKPAREGLAAVGLGELADTPAAYLSAGQRRRLSLARLVAVHRPVWLLDEPTTALDAQAQQTLASLMRAHLARGGLIVAATHGPLPLDRSHKLHLGGAA